MLANRALHHMQVPIPMAPNMILSDTGELISPLYASPQETQGWDTNAEYFARNELVLMEALKQKWKDARGKARRAAREYVDKRNKWLKKLKRAQGAAGPNTTIVTTAKKRGRPPLDPDGAKSKKKKSKVDRKESARTPVHRYPSRSHLP